MTAKNKFAFWHWTPEQIFLHLHSREGGLASHEAQARLRRYGPNLLRPPRRARWIFLFFSQFKNPIILLLLGASLLSFFLGGKTDALIIMTIVVLSGLLGFFQEKGALNALEKLLQLVENKATVLRDGKEQEVPLEKIVPGDVVVLRAGNLIPADCVLTEARHFYVDEATLTGESAPVEKAPFPCPLEHPHLKRPNALFLGTMVASGMAKAVVIATGHRTEYSHLFEKIRFRTPETAFEQGVRRFGYLLLKITLFLVIFIFAANTFLQKPVLESFLFSLALAVGITPQLLPAIISVNLSHGARRMAQKKVIVKRLPSIENFGQMNILCTDKTGTITEGKMTLSGTVGVDGSDSAKVKLYGFLNAHFQGGYTNPLDQAILEAGKLDASEWKKIDEIPYDFIHKRLSVILEKEGGQILIVKGAIPQVLTLCSRMELPDGSIVPINDSIAPYFEEKSRQGFRSLALAYGEGDREENLIFLGFLHFLDPIKPDIVAVIADMKQKGISLKILTGDHSLVTAHVAAFLGFPSSSIITGEELRNTTDRALVKLAHEKQIFAQLEPNQKERIILALRESGNIVGYLGDGINDISALHGADVGIAVDSGAAAAKEAADIVLLKKDLSVLRTGVEEGRRTFINTLKYVYMATSANLGNMFSMAGVSLFLSFLPLLPKQVLLTNFFSDLPEMALATDHVDPERLEGPVKWDLPLIRRFMIVFGLLNSLVDYLTFGFLLFWYHADIALFRSGWFVANIASAALVILAIRTRRWMFGSKPGRLLLFSVFTVAIGVFFFPFTHLGAFFGFVPVPLPLYGCIIGIIAIYLFAVEIAKRKFFKS